MKGEEKGEKGWRKEVESGDAFASEYMCILFQEILCERERERRARERGRSGLRCSYI